MQASRHVRTTIALAALGLCLAPGASRGQSLASGHVLLEFVGQVLNLATTPATSHQLGYLTYLRGVDRLFTGTPNEQTALFTFYNVTTTRSVTALGTLRVITRDGEMTIYLKTGSADFANPDSFRAGTPVLVASLRHTVVVNTATSSFVANFENTITRSDPFRVDGEIAQIGRPAEIFRISIAGQLESPGPPSGWIAGTAFVVSAVTPTR